MKDSPKTMREVRRQVEVWNQENPVGCAVEVLRDDGTKYKGLTASLAMVANDESWIPVEGIKADGKWLSNDWLKLDRVTRIQKDSQ